MNTNNERTIKRRKLCTLLGILILIIPVAIYFRGIKLEYSKNNIEPKQGIIYINDVNEILESTYTLNGQWISYEENYNEESIKELSYSQLPEVNLNTAKQARTYELNVYGEFGEDNISELMLYIPFVYSDTNVRVNGIDVEYSLISTRSINDSETDRLYYIGESFDSSKKYQSITISVNNSGENFGLFRREICITSAETINQKIYIVSIIENILFGMMVVSLLLGLVYMLILPGHKMLSSMTMFDTTLMLYVFFNISTIPISLFNGIFPGLFGEPVIRGLTLSMFCWMAYWANKISLELFDMNEELNPKYTKLISRIWIVGIVINGLVPQYYNKIGTTVTLIVYVMTFMAASIRIQICRRNGDFGRNLMVHAAKATYVGLLLGYDIITFNICPRKNVILLLGYSLFFFIEFLMRATVYKEAFDKIRSDRAQLEKQVKIRTEELEIVNYELRNLMGIDGLTKAKNRLYFEESLELMFEETDKKFSMCIFDLDKFKVINDTYGHGEGDEQLKDVVSLMKDIIDDNCIFARIGGEEFAVLFTDHLDEEIIKITENIRVTLEQIAKVNKKRTTGSFGIAKVRPNDTKKSLFKRADECLYHSKNNGRNCITSEFDKREIHKNK